MFIEPYLGTVTVFAGNFAPRSWMFCQGQLLAIAQYDALFALLGTTYGGDGQNTFALPDLRGRHAVHQGQGPGLSNYVLGEMAGTESTTLMNINMPMHTHSMLSFTVQQSASTATTSGVTNPINAYPAAGSTVYAPGTGDGAMGSFSSISSTSIAGGNQPIGIASPYLAMNYIIAVEGIFPSRN